FEQFFRTAVMVDPHQGPPDLNVEYFLIRKRLVPQSIAAACVQFEVAREWLQHCADGYRKKSFDDETAVLLAQFIDRFERELQRCILRISRPVLFKLKEQKA